MLSGELPAIRSWLRRTVRPAWLEKIADARRACARDARRLAAGAAEADGHYIFDFERRALLLLRVRYPVLAALVITVVDALPVFGTGRS